MSVETIWNGFKNWIADNAPGLEKVLNPGATNEQLDELEKIVGKELPSDFRAIYKVHNGQDAGEDGLLVGEEILAIDRIADEWIIWKELLDADTFCDENGSFVSAPDEGVKNDWWNPGWIPVTYDGAGNHYCVDLDPDESGTYGQIIRMWHDSDEREIVAESMKDWMQQYVQDLEDEKFYYSNEYGGIVEREYEENI